MNNLVSVIIPLYNQGELLAETIESVNNSNYGSIEIIIVDDGSTDDSLQVAKKISKKHNHIHCFTQPNQGPSVARNYGISLSSGSYILPLDSDDLIHEDYISRAVEVLEERKEVKVVYCEAEKFGEKDGFWHLEPFSLDLLARKNMIFVSGIFRKSDWEECGQYDKEMIWGSEDWEFWISLLKNGGEVVKLPFVGFYYRIRTSSRRKSVNKERNKKIVDYVNFKHKEFIYDKLDGPLHYQKTHSKKINRILNFFRGKRII